MSRGPFGAPAPIIQGAEESLSQLPIISASGSPPCVGGAECSVGRASTNPHVYPPPQDVDLVLLLRDASEGPTGPAKRRDLYTMMHAGVREDPF